MALTPTEQRTKTTAHFRGARWFVIGVLLIGGLLVVFLRERKLPEVVLLPPSTAMQYNPMPDRWIPRTWGWMWRLRDVVMGRRAPVNFSAFILRPLHPALLTALERALVADLERLAEPALDTNGLRIWSLDVAKFDNAMALARKAVANRPDPYLAELDAILHPINTADGVRATTFNGGRFPVAGGRFAEVGTELQVLPRTRKRTTDITLSVKDIGMLGWLPSDAGGRDFGPGLWPPQPNAAGERDYGPMIRTNLWQAARVQVPIGGGIMLMQSPSQTQPGVLLLLSVGRK